MKTFELLDRIQHTSGLLWVYQSMEIELEEFKKRNPDSQKIKDVQIKIDKLHELYKWIVINYEGCETLQRTCFEFQKMNLHLTIENTTLKSENEKLTKLIKEWE